MVMFAGQRKLKFIRLKRMKMTKAQGRASRAWGFGPLFARLRTILQNPALCFHRSRPKFHVEARMRGKAFKGPPTPSTNWPRRQLSQETRPNLRGFDCRANKIDDPDPFLWLVEAYSQPPRGAPEPRAQRDTAHYQESGRDTVRAPLMAEPPLQA